jgi:hypothetical protein
MDFFTKVYAYEPDEVAKPTIPFTPPSLTITPAVSPTTGFTNTPTPIGPRIYLETPKAQVGINEKLLVQVRIDTNGKAIKSFKFNIKFDPQYFQITDSDTTIPNVQISYKDTFFVSQLNEVDTATGSITVSGSTEEGTATISGRNVAEFELTSLKEGFTQIQIQQAFSSLLDSNNTDLLKEVKSISITIATNPIPTITTSTATTITPTVIVSGTLPRNGIFDEIGAANAFITGALLIVAGAFMFRLQRHAKKKV